MNAMLDIEQSFRALSDRTRIRILRLLEGGALCVGDLVAVLDVPQPFASRHLAYLRKAGLVTEERRGKWVFYGLAPAESEFHAKLVGCLKAAPTGEQRRDQAALAKLRRKGGCCPQHS
jgi:ArsR family transcriptional regulator